MKIAQKYIDEEEINAMKDGEWQRSRDRGRWKDNKEKYVRTEKGRESPYRPRFHKYTLLTTTRTKALMMVEKTNLLQWPPHTRFTPAKRFSSKYCRFHREIGHDTEDCYQLKDEIERLVRQGYFREFILGQGFGGSEVASMGTITLPVSMGEEPKRKTLMIKFLVVDTPFAYNIILGRPDLNAFKAVVSTYHQKMKFPTKNGIGEVICDQKEARRCYSLSMKKGEPSEKVKRKERDDTKEPEPKKFKPERIEPVEEFKTVRLIAHVPEKVTRIGSKMSKAVETMMVEFLKENVDMFAWSPSDSRASIQKL
ncbi:UNVERIFIED_CONTAM: hypothetical protein Sradi_1510500 [Sesamum radiatum]|uniref:Reverse transcriptase domain-containing protein n=1 Tax=Sesamum radiatum TaxID=300843 RepID=A0AAW2U935_SESRA